MKQYLLAFFPDYSKRKPRKTLSMFRVFEATKTIEENMKHFPFKTLRASYMSVFR